MSIALLASSAFSRVDVVGTAAVAVAALVGAVVLGTITRSGLGTGRFTRCLVGALAVAGAGAALAALDMAHFGRDPWSLDLAFLAGAVAIGAALVHHPDLGSPRQRARVLADSLISGLSVAIMLWLVAGRAMFEQADRRGACLGLVAATAIGFAVTRIGLVVTASREERPEIQPASAVLTLAFLACTLGGVLRLLGEGHPGASWLAAPGYGGVVLGIALVCLAGSMLAGSGPQLPGRPDTAAIRSLLDVTPVVTATAAAGAVLVDAALRGAFDATASAVLTVVITSVLLRQSLMLADNRELSSSLRHTVDELEQQATHDTLTGLPNRLGLDDRIADAVGRSADAGTVCAVYFVDVDRLKSVNDTLGHGAGDQLIRTTAERLRGRVGECVTRFGGDEFVLVVDGLASRSEAEQLGRAIIEDAARSVRLDGHTVRSSSSVGVAVATAGVTAPELLRQADVALYRAKELGRRCAALYRPEEDEGRRANLDLEPELVRGVDRDEFTLHYQPIIALATGAVTGVESLLRWEHPERGLLTPDRFLDKAISSGMLGTIGETSLRRACGDFASLDPDLVPSVAVNLSGSELADTRVVRRVASALVDSGLSPARLTLEITEDVILDDTVRASIDELCALGVQLAIDDFGTGNSSLRQLGAYPANVLKIDKRFVDRLVDDERARAITATVVRLAADLGLTTVAEGVESAEQAELLARMGCDRAQGWLFARAMPFDDLREWCRAGTASVRYRPNRDKVASASSMMRASSSATGGRSSIAPTT